MSSILKTCYLICLFVITGSIAKAQDAPVFDKLVDFLPPAPNASAIIKYGDASVNKNQGTPNVSIPLFTVKGLKLSAPVSIGYSSGGLKVDELASRVGAGWAINAGGVVTRTVRGVPDEWNTRHQPYAAIGINYPTYNYMKRIATSQTTWGNHNGFDAEPDLFNFSFNGYSGSFVLDSNMNIVLINKSGIKIEKNFTSSAWNIKITTPDGTIYLFGGSTATETTKREQTCGKTFTELIPTSWYLKEIQHLNGEKIEFTYAPHIYKYDNGVSQTMSNPGFSGLGSGCTVPSVLPTSCVNIGVTNGVLLQSISSPGICSVDFNYTTRLDCQDKLISSIVYKEKGVTAGSFDFTYTTVTSSAAYAYETTYPYAGLDKTPYLTRLQESATGNTDHRTHYFSYNDPAARPYRLSFAQDHWGYFNGKLNTTLLPNLGVAWADKFPDATANRAPDFSYAQKGMLQKVIYPTGGINMLFYEANSGGAYNAYATPHKLSCDVTGTGDWAVQTKSKTFHIGAGAAGVGILPKLKLHCRVNDGSVAPFNHHNKANVEIWNTITNTLVFQKNYSPTQLEIDNVYSLVEGDYIMTIDAAGAMLTALAELTFTPNLTEPLPAPVEIGGVRVAKITTSNPDEAPMIKKYYYSTLDNMGTSSLGAYKAPVYMGTTYREGPCYSDLTYMFVYNTINSSSINNLAYFGGGSVSYGSVIEGIGEDFEGGGTESRFGVNADGLGLVLFGKDIIHAPSNNYSSYYNGKVLSEMQFKKGTGSSFIPVKKTSYNYKNDALGENVVYGFACVETSPSFQAIDTTCALIACAPHDGTCCYNRLVASMSRYSLMRYHVFSSWVYPETETQILYDENGLNPVTSTTNYFNESLQHLQVTKKEVVNSKGQTTRTTFKYPHDYTGTGDYSSMVSNNILSPLVDVKSEIVSSPSNIPLSESKINYSNSGNNNFTVASIQKSVKGNTLETEGTITQYDDKGNILEFTGKNGVTSSIVWGYGQQYPVAQVVGATYANVVAQLSVSMSALQLLDGATLRTELHRIRTGIPAANVTTYTYKPLTGVTSITDANNKINTYEYDGFKQLLIVRDQDGNAVKKNEYVYAVPDPNASIDVYFNDLKTTSITVNNCIAGFMGSSVIYTVPEGKYYSFISKDDANAKRDTDILTIGQDYANRNGFCSNSASCTTPGYKFVSCGCELGVKVCESSTPHPTMPGYYLNTLHWLWSDGSISPGFSETMPPCDGVDKKKIGCNCETGVKVCDNVTNNGGGSYTVTYHYHFSDNTNSATQTETLTCSGPDKKMIGCNCETGVKLYSASVICGKFGAPPGCCTGMWLCTYHYRWSDASVSADYTECSPTTCMLVGD